MAAGAALEPFSALSRDWEGDPIPEGKSSLSEASKDGFGSLLSHWEGHLAQGTLFVDIEFKSTQNGRYEKSTALFQDRHAGVHVEGKSFIEQSLFD